MYGFCRDGSRPKPPAGIWAAGSFWNGGETNAAMAEKKIAVPPMTAATQGISSRLRWRFWYMTRAPEPRSTVSHRSSDPGWLAQSEVTR